MKIPGVPMKLPEGAAPYLAIGAVVLVLYYAAKHEAKSAALAIAHAVDPTSDQNLFYKGVNSVGQVVTQNQGFSLGGWLWEQLHPGQVAAENGVARPTVNPGNNTELNAGGGV